MKTNKHGFQQPEETAGAAASSKVPARNPAENFLDLPSSVWSRLVVLLVALVGIKVALLGRLGKRPFEVHWRITPHTPVWGDYVLFGFFVVIGFASLMQLQRHCALAGMKAVRAANAIVLSIG